MANPHPNRSRFTSLTDYFLTVRRAAETKDPDQRLYAAAAPVTEAQEGSGTDGGYLVPPEWRSNIVGSLLAETSLLSYTDRYPVGSNALTIPMDASPQWLSTGLQPTPEPEGALLGQSKLALQGRTVRLAKAQVTVPVSNELAEDAGALESYLIQAAGSRLDFKLTDWLISGDGVNKPLGILNSPALVTQAAESGQTAGTVVYANVTKLWSRLWGPSKARAVWIMHSAVEQALQNMTLPPGVLTYPADDLPRLFGRPILVSEAAQAIGSVGDVMLVDPKAILTATRQGIAFGDISAEVFFDLDLSAYRFTTRVGAAPWWAAPVTQYHGGATVSSAVALAAR